MPSSVCLKRQSRKSPILYLPSAPYSTHFRSPVSCAGSENNSPETAGKDNVTYLISVYHPDFREIVDYPVTVQDRIETILPVALEPLSGVREG